MVRIAGYEPIEGEESRNDIYEGTKALLGQALLPLVCLLLFVQSVRVFQKLRVVAYLGFSGWVFPSAR